MVIHCVFWWFIVIENCQPENRGKSMGFLLENRWKPIWTILKPTAPWFGIYFIRPPCIDQQWWCPWEFWDKCFVFREMMVVFLGTLGYCCYSGEHLMWYSWCNAEIMWSMAIAAVKSPYVGRFNHLKMWCTTNTLTWLYGHLWVYRYTPWPLTCWNHPDPPRKIMNYDMVQHISQTAKGPNNLYKLQPWDSSNWKTTLREPSGFRNVLSTGVWPSEPFGIAPKLG
jgi:hypothetical protein